MNVVDLLSGVIPTEAQVMENKKIAKVVMERVSAEIYKHPEVMGAELGGSYAKDTWLAGETDIDVFVKFSQDTSDDAFKRISREIGFRSMAGYEPRERYANHPYVEATISDVMINVVPCFDVELGGWRSAADRSPYHTAFMRRWLTDDMRNEVRLLKRLLKSWGIYGAQISVQGFSGYATEALILHFGGFGETMQGMANIKRGTVIGKAAKKFDTPVTIMDPIDENRNLATAISNRNMGLFILRCREQETSTVQASAKATDNSLWGNVVAVRFRRGDENAEIIWGQVRRATTAIARHMERGGFAIIRHKILVDDVEVCLLFLTESLHIPEMVVRTGPEIFRRAESAVFASSKDMVWVSPDMKLLRMEKREHHTAGSLLRHILRNPQKAGIPAGLHPYIREGASVTTGGKIAQSVKEEATGLVCTDEAVLYAARDATG